MIKPRKCYLLNVWYNNLTMKKSLQYAENLLSKSGKHEIYFLNADHIYKALYDKNYQEILCSASMVLGDGVGLKILTKIMGSEMRENCNGTDFTPLFLRRIAKKGLKVYILGGRKNDIKKAKENLTKKIPQLEIVGFFHGYFKDNESYQVIKRINESGADILIVGRGSPLQEKWISKYRSQLNPKLCLGVGALIDFWSNRFIRAPHFFRVLHLEWLIRFLQEPRRLFTRYFIHTPYLFYLAIRERARGDHN